MRILLLSLLAALVAFGADSDWAKVKALKTGSELQIWKKGAAQPISALMGDLTDENLIVLIKKTESAIRKDDIDRIDARPPAGKRLTRTKTDKEEVGPDGQITTSSGGGLSFGSKPDFETVYKRPQAPPKK
jgi:hypothetical protein